MSLKNSNKLFEQDFLLLNPHWLTLLKLGFSVRFLTKSYKTVPILFFIAMKCVMLICLYYDLKDILDVCILLHMHVYTKVHICNGDYIEIYWALKLNMLK